MVTPVHPADTASANDNTLGLWRCKKEEEMSQMPDWGRFDPKLVDEFLHEFGKLKFQFDPEKRSREPNLWKPEIGCPGGKEIRCRPM